VGRVHATAAAEAVSSRDAGGIGAGHAYAYGRCIIQDMGYYPFGSRLFSDLNHYVRSGDFITALNRDSQDLNEYAFALGALEHYAADTEGHRMATNRAVPMLYPEGHRKRKEPNRRNSQIGSIA
jgi:Zinc dependent phospholipase C